MRAALEWSHRLLDPAEQLAFRSLAVFVGGFDADATRAVVPGLSFDLLARLVDKSLVGVTESARGKTRYRLLESVREYAYELLIEASELEAARERHLRHFAALADVAREEWLATGKQRFVNELDDDYENFRAALEWAAGHGSMRCDARAWGNTRPLLEEAVGLAFGTSTPRPVSPTGVSARELEVARLVARAFRTRRSPHASTSRCAQSRATCATHSPSSAS